MVSQPLGRFTRGKMQIIDPTAVCASLREPALLDWGRIELFPYLLPIVAQVELSTLVAHALAVLFFLNPRGRVGKFCSANSLSYRLR